MISSMTAYAQHEINCIWGKATWEIRSLNYRYLDINFDLPNQLSKLEFLLREIIRNRIKRGKLECKLHFMFNTNVVLKLIFNKKLAKQLINAANWIKANGCNGEINPVDILNYSGVISIDSQINNNSIFTEVTNAFDCAVNQLVASRRKEGEMLKFFIEEKLQLININLKKIREYMPEIIKWQRKRILNKFKDISVLVENNRLEQELILIAQRIDITEELDRLDAHIKETYDVLNKDDVIGRRLDFIMQEFNRESNTIAAKSINYNITNSAINIKILIEQIREQIQNLE